MENTLSRVSFIVHQKQKFPVSDHLLCTISGGQDSILNLIILYNLEALYEFRISLAYCNHFWQQTNFYSEFELFKFAYLINKPIANLVPKKRLVSEEEAHFWRQYNFYQIGTYLNLNNIILGHTLSDKIETSLWHFIRGSGPNGLISLKQNSFLNTKNFKKLLAPIYWKPKNSKNKRKIKFFGSNNEQKKYFLKINLEYHTFKCTESDCAKRQCYSKTKYTHLQKVRPIHTFKLNLVSQQYTFSDCAKRQYIYCVLKGRIQIKRPVLGFSRTTISQLIKQNKLPRIIDTTNQSKKLIRNKLRLFIIPLLNCSLQIRFHRNINKYINIIEQEQIYFSSLENKLMKIYLNNPLALNSLGRLPIAIKRYIIKTLLDNYISNQVILNYIMHISNFQD
jgi:tRNA(Ile)-lysidine synthase TilS/MesJ